jgi:hypothetical protein
VLGLGSVAAHAATPFSEPLPPPDPALQLDREVLRGDRVTGSPLTGECINGGGNFKFSVGGTAFGPYPGTFTESGSFTITNKVLSAFSATFTITTSAGRVTGTKSLSEGNSALCDQDATTTHLTVLDFLAFYTATSNGTDQVTGISAASISGDVPEGGVFASPPDFEERFGASCQGLCQNVPPPTSKSQCKHGGWKSFGTMFKNQGDCVSFVASGGKNPPSGA